MNLRPLASLSAAFTLALVACSSSSSGSSVSNDQASDDVAKAICQKYETCAPLFVQLGYGDEATCETRVKLLVLPSLTANGTGATTSQYETCVGDVSSASCDDVFSRNLPASCQTVAGTLADGMACGVDAQCKNKLCRIPSGQSCGVCSSVSVAGGDCVTDSQCDVGLTCIQDKCVPYGAAGASCDNAHPCKPTLACSSGTCATPGEAGAACPAAGQGGCDTLKGLFCGTDKVCAAVGTAAPGKACGFVDNTIVACTSGGRCQTPTDGGTGTCEAAAADGQACDDIAGPPCLAPATCANGVCKISDPTACK
ncbi:MAG TPA: hypothetical protein VF407_19830 [Polyangiaceae bacterium]